MQAEMLAATLAWLAGLPCPVINRPSAALWYRGRASLLAWRPLLRRCGLPVPDQLITNDPAEARAFGQRLAADGVAGAVYTPLTGEAGYLVATDAAWQGLADLQERSPVCLSEPHGAAQPACIVGGQIFWDDDPPPEARALEPRLGQLAAATGLDFLEVVTAPLRGGLGVVMVEPMPVLEHFAPPTRDRILDALTALLAPVAAEPEAVRMILVCGGLADSVTELVCARLQHSGYPYRLLDLAHYPAGYRVAWRWTDAGPVGTIAGPDWVLDLDEITGVYVRFLGPEGRLPPQGDPEDAAALQFEADAGLMALLDDLPCPVVNRIGGGMSNNSKPYQALLLRRAGLEVPATLVTSDPAAARAFQAEYGDVIYKSASGIRSIVRRLGPDQLARLAFLRDGPAQFQAFVPGRNVRVHTVGDAVFATRIETEAVDYRYAHLDGLDVAMTPVTLPAAVEDACLRAARDLDLLFAGIDLKETPDGEYVCFEVNPCPGFIYYERHTGQQISTALADLLNGTARPPGARPAQPLTHNTTRRQTTMADNDNEEPRRNPSSPRPTAPRSG